MTDYWLGPISSDLVRSDPSEDEVHEDQSIELQTQFSDAITFNTLFVPEVELSGKYNYYTSRENDDEHNESKPKVLPNLAPMFIRIGWKPVNYNEVVAKIADTFHGINLEDLPIGDLEYSSTINKELDKNSIIIIRR